MSEQPTSAFLRHAAAWAAGAAVARSTAVDGAARRALPGLAAAASVVPLAVPSLLLSEFPGHALALHGGLTARHVARSGLRGRSAAVALALSVGTTAALARGRRDSARAGEVLEAALQRELGPSYRTGLDPECLAADAPLTRRQVWLPPLPRRRRHLGAADLSYGPAGRHNHLDVWRRADLPDDASAPVLVQVHASAWVRGSKRGQGYPLLAHMAERGWVGVAINYSLAPRARWPAHIVDVKRALAWVKREIGRHGGDPAFVALTGGSAGGHLTALAALSAGDPAFQPGFEDDDTSVAAAVPCYGVYDFMDRAGDAPAEQEAFLERIVIGRSKDEAPDVWERASPLSWVRPDAPPFFVIHGAIDTLTNPAQARAFADALRHVSRRPVVHAELPGAQHCFDLLPSVRTTHTIRAIDRFLAHVRLNG
jgi:acetyl esterase/lipase